MESFGSQFFQQRKYVEWVLYYTLCRYCISWNSYFINVSFITQYNLICALCTRTCATKRRKHRIYGRFVCLISCNKHFFYPRSHNFYDNKYARSLRSVYQINAVRYNYDKYNNYMMATVRVGAKNVMLLPRRFFLAYNGAYLRTNQDLKPDRFLAGARTPVKSTMSSLHKAFPHPASFFFTCT